MFKNLIKTPLHQALMLIWFLGLINLIHFPLKEGYCSIDWIFSALLAGLLSLLMAARLRRPIIVSLAIILGLGGLLVSFYQVNVSDLSILGLIIALYCLFLWLAALWMLAHSFLPRILERFKLTGGYRGNNGAKAVENVIHRTCLTIIITTILAVTMETWSMGLIPVAPLLLVPVAMTFLLLAGKRYESRFHSYLFIIFAAWLAVTLFAGATSLASSTAVKVLSLNNPSQGLMLALVGLVALLLGGWLRTQFDEKKAAEAVTITLYLRPLLISALVFCALAVAQGIGLALTGGLVGPAWLTLISCAIASFVLLAANHFFRHYILTFSGAGLGSFIILWLYSAVFHNDLPFGHGAAIGDQCLLLSFLALALAFMAPGFSQSKWQDIYEQPIFALALVFYGLSCFGGLALVAHDSARFPFLPLMILVLILAAFPLTYRFSNGAHIRGLGIACLLSLLVTSLLDSLALERQEAALFFCGWAYVMWLISNLLLPRFNLRFPRWPVAIISWPWLGLLSMGLGLYLTKQPVILQWDFSLYVAGFLFLMARNSMWPGFRWLAILTLTWSGLVFSGASYLVPAGPAFSAKALGRLAMENLLWVNILLLGVSWWRRKGAKLFKEWGWLQTEMAETMIVCTLGVCCLWLAVLANWVGKNILAGSSFNSLSLAEVGIGGLLSLSFLHGLWLSRFKMVVNLFFMAIFCTLLALWATFHPFQLPIFLALWACLLLVADWRLKTNEGFELIQLLSCGVRFWLPCSLLITLLAVIIVPNVSVAERLITLVLASYGVAVLGCRQQNRIWLLGAVLMFVVVLHGLWFVVLDYNIAGLLLPWFSMELTITAWGLQWLIGKILCYQNKLISDQQTIWHLIRKTLTQVLPFIVGLALFEWFLHFYSFAMALLAGKNPRWFVNYGDPFIALLAISLLAGWLVLLIRDRKESFLVYGITLLTGFAGIYIRLLWVGVAPPCVWDTAILLAAACGLFVLQHYILSGPLLNIVLVLPLLALVSVLFQQNSAYTCLTLLVAGALYLWTRRETGRGLFLYLGILAINGAIYLWVPSLVDRSGLLQVYLIPAALTVLLLTHLHRHELKPSVQNSVKLTALAILYSAVTLDVFLVDSLQVFILALILCMSGLMVGIALRTRAFLYTSTAFLILNVLGQLLQLYPEQRLGRALVLMGLGAMITGAMIWFNIKRELILRRIRIYRADLETWN